MKEIHPTQRINICDTHLKRNAIDLFLKRIITGGEKWIVYNDVNRKRSWSKHDEPAQTTTKAELYQEKIMLSIWWDCKSVVYFELLSNNRTINSDVYCQQRVKLEEAIKRIGKSQRNRVSPQCEVPHIFSNTYETIGARLGSDVASPVQIGRAHV